MRPELDNVLQCLSLNGYSVLSLISDILAYGSNREDCRIKCLLEGVEQDAVDICARFLNHNTTSTSVTTWALDVALQSKAINGPRFMTGHSLSPPNGDVVSPGLSFGTVSTPTHYSPEGLLNIRSTRFVKYKRVVIIDPLPDNVFLEIFDLCLCDPTEYPVRRTREWITLVHICQRWRRIIFASPRRLDLYLSCICGTPVRRNLVYWPPILPLVIDYPRSVFFSMRTPGDDDNIIVALTHTDRIHHVNIYATSSLFRKLATVMQKSFPVLTRLQLTWDQKDLQVPVLPRRFLGGSAPRLEYLYLSGVSFPRLPTILLSASNLLTLRLGDILESVPPETMVVGLTVLTRLRTLSIKFNKGASQPDQWRSRSNPPVPTILPALTTFRYTGYSEYLEDLLALIDTPLVNDITIEYFLAEIQVSQLSRFIGRTKTFKNAKFRRAHVNFYYDFVDVELELPQGEPQANITLTLLDAWIDIQVSYAVEVLDKLVAMFSNVGHLSTHGECSQWRDLEDLDSIEWLQFLRLFPAVEQLHLSGDVVRHIASALEDIAEEMLTEVMPILHSLWLDEDDRSEDDKPVGSIERFLSLRQLSGRPVTVVDFV
ncbi:hypothetical protein V8E53_001394 [Lactarius tabidus]